MNAKFQKGDRVKLNDPRNIYNGQIGTVVAIDPDHSNPYQFQLDGDDYAFWYNAERLAATEEIAPAHRQSTPSTSLYDFSHSGLGIGGLSSHTESATIPTIAQMERLEKMEASATYCRKCGQSDVFDGAMFTTGGGSVCDDCF